jgi:hypothetical protein
MVETGSILPMRPAVFAIVAFQLLLGNAHACRFAQDAPPEQWHEWSTSLFSADVMGLELDAQKSLDVISVRVVETFRGPEGAAAASLRVPSRMWSSCYLERPRIGARVLVALNPNGDTLVVPLTEAYRDRLRRLRGKQPAPSIPAPQPAAAPPQAGERPFSY